MRASVRVCLYPHHLLLLLWQGQAHGPVQILYHGSSQHAEEGASLLHSRQSAWREEGAYEDLPEAPSYPSPVELAVHSAGGSIVDV